MAKKEKEKGKGGHVKAVGLVALVAVSGLLLWGALTGWKFSVTGPSGTPPAVFSLLIRDPNNIDVDIDPIDGDLVLMGLEPGMDRTSAASWEAITGFADCADLTEARVLAALEDYSDLWAIYNFTVVNDEYSFNDDFGDRTYGERQCRITAGANVLETYVYPTLNASFEFHYAINGSLVGAVNVTAIDGANVTMTLFLNNMTVDAYDQEFCAYTDYTGNVIQPNLVFSFRSGITAATHDVVPHDLVFVGLTNEQVTTSSLRYKVSSLGVTPQTYQGYWGPTIIADGDAIYTNNASSVIFYNGGAAI